MQVLIAPTENIILGEKTTFSADVAAGETTITCNNAKNFSVDDYVILGTLGSETAEICQISAIASDLTSITLSSATKFKHLEDDPIQVTRYNQRKFYRSSSENGTYTELTSEGSPVDISVDLPEGTEFEDSSGTSSSWYKATYFNSTTSVATNLSDAVATKAGDTEHYTSIYKIKEEAGFKNNSYITTDLVDRYRIEAEAQAESSIVGIYQLPFSSHPKIFQHIVTLLAAGLLLSKEYGIESDVEISKSGKEKIDRAEELLQKIIDGKIVLLDDDKNQLSKNTAVMASSSNAYDSNRYDKGVFFTLEDENFRAAEDDTGNESTVKSTTTSTGFK